MSTPFQSALDAYLLAREGHLAVVQQRAWSSKTEAERTLAQAGDVLEGELRRMMREEVVNGVRARYVAQIPPPRYGME